MSLFKWIYLLFVAISLFSLNANSFSIYDKLSAKTKSFAKSLPSYYEAAKDTILSSTSDVVADILSYTDNNESSSITTQQNEKKQPSLAIDRKKPSYTSTPEKKSSYEKKQSIKNEKKPSYTSTYEKKPTYTPASEKKQLDKKKPYTSTNEKKTSNNARNTKYYKSEQEIAKKKDDYLFTEEIESNYDNSVINLKTYINSHINTVKRTLDKSTIKYSTLLVASLLFAVFYSCLSFCRCLNKWGKRHKAQLNKINQLEEQNRILASLVQHGGTFPQAQLVDYSQPQLTMTAQQQQQQYELQRLTHIKSQSYPEQQQQQPPQPEQLSQQQPYTQSQQPPPTPQLQPQPQQPYTPQMQPQHPHTPQLQPQPAPQQSEQPPLQEPQQPPPQQPQQPQQTSQQQPLPQSHQPPPPPPPPYILPQPHQVQQYEHYPQQVPQHSYPISHPSLQDTSSFATSLLSGVKSYVYLGIFCAIIYYTWSVLYSDFQLAFLRSDITRGFNEQRVLKEMPSYCNADGTFIQTELSYWQSMKSSLTGSTPEIDCLNHYERYTQAKTFTYKTAAFWEFLKFFVDNCTSILRAAFINFGRVEKYEDYFSLIVGVVLVTFIIGSLWGFYACFAYKQESQSFYMRWCPCLCFCFARPNDNCCSYCCYSCSKHCFQCCDLFYDQLSTNDNNTNNDQYTLTNYQQSPQHLSYLPPYHLPNQYPLNQYNPPYPLSQFSPPYPPNYQYSPYPPHTPYPPYPAYSPYHPYPHPPNQQNTSYFPNQYPNYSPPSSQYILPSPPSSQYILPSAPLPVDAGQPPPPTTTSEVQSHDTNAQQQDNQQQQKQQQEHGKHEQQNEQNQRQQQQNQQQKLSQISNPPPITSPDASFQLDERQPVEQQSSEQIQKPIPEIPTQNDPDL